MLIVLLIVLFALILIPAICIHAMNRKDVDPSIQFLAMLVLSPFIHFLILVFRRNL